MIKVPRRRRTSSLARDRAAAGDGSNSAAMWSVWSNACSCARATVRVLAGGPRQGALSKRTGRAKRVARLHNLSADVLIANLAAPVRKGLRDRWREMASA